MPALPFPPPHRHRHRHGLHRRGHPRWARATAPPRHDALSPNAFTLIELMTTLAIMIVLASCLLPALHRGKAFAQRAGCQHHLRQWGLATHLYAEGHDDTLPPEGSPNPTDRHTNVGWYVQLPRELSLPPYSTQPWRTNPLASIAHAAPWLCPANRRRSNGRNLFHYCLNQHLDGTADEDSVTRLASVPRPSTLVWLFDSKNLPAVGPRSYTHTNVHGAGAQFLFLDGHVARFRVESYWDTARQRPRSEGHPDLEWEP
ncbi:MAG: type II secretion system protein [Verrucomicrobiales bacterium]|nr:type II secretion system protein [Verrucomicrobiales bacterium]